MKLKHSLVLCSVALGVVAGRAQEIKLNLPAQGGQPAPAAAAPAAPAKPSFTDAQIVEELGWFYGKKMGLSELGFSKAELESLIKGMTAASENKDSPYELEKIGPMVDEFMQKKQTAYMAKVKDKNAADAQALFAKLKENKNVVELPDGLRYEILKPGAGAYPKAEDTVKVLYTGTLIDGTVFDSTADHNNEPLVIGLKDVVPGWTEGLQKINKGGKIKLYIPPQLGYGDRGQGQIPPGSTLIFEVELIDINPPAANAGAPAVPPPPAGK